MSDEMRPSRRPSCPRTGGFIERIARDAVTPADREHALGCDACGPVLATAVRFDDALRRSARDLVIEQMPHGILDPALLPDHRAAAGRRALPNFAGILAAVVILVMASSLGILPGGPKASGGPPGTTSPTDAGPTPGDTGLGMHFSMFRSTVSVITEVRALGYSCYPGHELSGAAGSFDPEREGVACKSGKDEATYWAGIATRERGEGDAKEVVEVSMDGALVGVDSAKALDDLTQALGKLTFLAIGEQSTARQVADFVVRTVPDLDVLAEGDEAEGTVAGIQISLMRHPDGKFYVLLAAARP